MKKGDFVKVSYTGWFEGNLIETTDEATAKKEGAHNEKGSYEPTVIVIGEGHVLPGLDRTLEGMKVGEEKKVELKAKDAFGERSFRLIQLVPLREFKKQNIAPLPGMVFEVEGRPARIQSVSGGRVRVDFNHPLAGKDVKYEIKIEADAKTEANRIEFLLERAFKDAGVKYKTSGTGAKKKITVEVTENVKAKKLYQIMQMVFKTETKKYLGIEDIEFKGPEAKTEKKPAKR
jgi:FKBP-type peptidyl-prolyl cis-trans isomerase 2